MATQNGSATKQIGTAAVVSTAIIAGVQSSFLGLDKDLAVFIVTFVPLIVSAVVWFVERTATALGYKPKQYVVAVAEQDKNIELLKSEIQELKAMSIDTTKLEKKLTDAILAKSAFHALTASGGNKKAS